MTFEIIIRPEAEIDIINSVEWYEEKRFGLGREFLQCLSDAFELIKQNPVLYQKIYKDIRRSLPRRFPYEIFFLIDGNKIIVLGVLHAKRNPQIIQHRLK